MIPTEKNREAAASRFFLCFQKLLQKPLPVQEKHFRHLIALCILIGTGVNRSPVKGQDLAAGDPQQNGGVGGDEKLGALPDAPDDLQQKRQLPLGDRAASGSSRKYRPRPRKLLRMSARKLSPWDFSWKCWGTAWGRRLYSSSLVATL